MKQEFLKKAFELINFYQKAYKDKFGKNEPLNRNKLQYSIANMFYDFDPSEVKNMMLFYIKTDTQPKLQRFCYEYDEIFEQMKLQKEDKDLRLNLMKETKRSVEQYKQRFN